MGTGWRVLPRGVRCGHVRDLRRRAGRAVRAPRGLAGPLSGDDARRDRRGARRCRGRWRCSSRSGCGCRAASTTARRWRPPPRASPACARAPRRRGASSAPRRRVRHRRPAGGLDPEAIRSQIDAIATLLVLAGRAGGEGARVLRAERPSRPEATRPVRRGIYADDRELSGKTALVIGAAGSALGPADARRRGVERLSGRGRRVETSNLNRQPLKEADVGSARRSPAAARSGAVSGRRRRARSPLRGRERARARRCRRCRRGRLGQLRDEVPRRTTPRSARAGRSSTAGSRLTTAQRCSPSRPPGSAGACAASSARAAARHGALLRGGGGRSRATAGAPMGAEALRLLAGERGTYEGRLFTTRHGARGRPAGRPGCAACAGMQPLESAPATCDASTRSEGAGSERPAARGRPRLCVPDDLREDEDRARAARRGRALEIRFPGEPLESVPRSAAEDGHRVVAVEPLAGEPGAFRVLVEKGAEARRSGRSRWWRRPDVNEDRIERYARQLLVPGFGAEAQDRLGRARARGGRRRGRLGRARASCRPASAGSGSRTPRTSHPPT